jgi:nucleotide-binding universal stress UspA family protein
MQIGRKSWRLFSSKEWAALANFGQAENGAVRENHCASYNSPPPMNAAAPIQTETTSTIPQLASVPPRHIMVAVDFTPECRRAAFYAVRLAKDLRARVTLLHISQEPVFCGYRSEDRVDRDTNAFYQKQAADQLSSELAAMRQIYGEVGATLRCGLDPCAEILKATKEFKVDLLVTAACGYSALKRPSYGRKETSLIFYAHCPVLVVH